METHQEKQEKIIRSVQLKLKDPLYRQMSWDKLIGKLTGEALEEHYPNWGQRNIEADRVEQIVIKVAINAGIID